MQVVSLLNPINEKVHNLEQRLHDFIRAGGLKSTAQFNKRMHLHGDCNSARCVASSIKRRCAPGWRVVFCLLHILHILLNSLSILVLCIAFEIDFYEA